MAKRKDNGTCMEEIKSNKLDYVRQFWENHYKKAKKNEPYVTCAEVYRFFTRENPNTGLDMSEIVRQSMQLGVGYKKCRKKSVFTSSPLSHSSKSFHGAKSPLTSFTYLSVVLRRFLRLAGHVARLLHCVAPEMS